MCTSGYIRSTPICNRERTQVMLEQNHNDNFCGAEHSLLTNEEKESKLLVNTSLHTCIHYFI